jgi:hypothetical protein
MTYARAAIVGRRVSTIANNIKLTKTSELVVFIEVVFTENFKCIKKIVFWHYKLLLSICHEVADNEARRLTVLLLQI